MANRLSNETSPYLLQHAHNPVDWFPWGEAALQRARVEGKPIFLSIGYSACHWCHVMERESFEDPALAGLLNEAFVCIKVDREERPDLDQIYMTAVQMLTGHGGWPMSVFLTPEGQPFYGGTYWPPRAQRGMPGFDQVLRAVREAWLNRRDDALQQASQLTHRIREFAISPAEEPAELAGDLVLQAARSLEQAFDYTHGGFGGAPKFPHPMDLQVLLRGWHRTSRDEWLRMVRLTLDKMAQGGIYDHLAGGFSRYSVDARWLVPHFEKMLYDNALLTGCYLDAFTATGHAPYAEVARRTMDYILTTMTDPHGGFYSAEDADSEGVEGKFYVWTPSEIREVLGPVSAERFCYVYDVSEIGNFESQNILNLPKTIEQCASLRGWNLEELQTELHGHREALLAVRSQRVRPGRDDKVLVSWNALMLESMARAGAILDEPRFLQAAIRAAEFLKREMTDPNGRLWHTWRDGRAHLAAYLDDYAYLANALVTLYETTFDERWIDESMRLTEIMRRHFLDSEQGGFYYTADDHEQLISRQKDFMDSSLPSSNGMAATVLSRLGRLCGRADFLTLARDTLAAGNNIIRRSSTAAGQLLVAHDLLTGPLPEIAIVGDPLLVDVRDTVKAFHQAYIPNRVVGLRKDPTVGTGAGHLDPLFQGRSSSPVPPSVHLCHKFVCGAPSSGKSAALKLWQDLSRPG